MSELYTLTVDGFPSDHFKVHAFTGRETISEPYVFDLVVTSNGTDADVERIALGQRAVLSWSIGMAPRAFYGILAAVELEEIHEAAPRAGRYRMRLVPRLWLLRRKRRTRIFQQMRVRDIVDAVLGEAGIATRWALLRDYPVREYCTQYEESDYRFLTRLLAESGVYFFFLQGPLAKEGMTAALIPGDSMIFGEDASGYSSIGGEEPDGHATEGSAPPLYFLAMQQTSTSPTDKVTRFSPRTTVRATKATFHDYDPERPMARLVSSAESTQPFPSPSASIPDTEIAAFTSTATGSPPGLEAYEHHGPFLFPKWSFAKEEAPLILRQKRRRASVASGDSGCPDLAPGHRFGLENHPAARLNREYVITAVEHRGETRPQGDTERRTYRNTFSCAPAEIAYVPPRPKRRSVQVALTAIVVGPPGEEIHVDALGQIKVQFHWDRDGAYDDRSSCWIRTMQAWGGAGWGAQFIPRVGMEVVVVFEGGDTDKPMILGSLYNGTHPPPFKLPGDRTRSGWRTQSSPGGNGNNELSFQDATGTEQIFLHAQRNFDELVEKNHTLLVKHDEFLRILGDRMDIIENSSMLKVGGNSEAQVAGAQTTQVGGSRVTAITVDDRLQVKEDAIHSVGHNYALEVHANYSVVVGASSDRGQSDHYVNGSGSIGAAERLVIHADKAIVLQCGETTIELTPEKLQLVAKAIDISGGKSVSMSGNGPSLDMGKDVQLVAKSIRLFAETSSLELDQNAKMKGEKMFLNCDSGDPSQEDSEPKKETQPFKCKFSDFDLKPYAGKTFHLRVEGQKLEGKTDADGIVAQDVPKGAKQVTVTLWIDQYPTGRQKTYTLALGDVPGADTPRGAQQRLKHLGYFHGKPDDKPTEEATRAIKWFQADHAESHGLTSSGELDGPTAGALKEVYGS